MLLISSPPSRLLPLEEIVRSRLLEGNLRRSSTRPGVYASYLSDLDLLRELSLLIGC